MSLFPRFVSHNREISPLLRLLDDFTTLSRSELPNVSSLRTFTPKFDIREVKDAYELHGELPGIEQKDIQIEWQDAQTLSISGRVEHHSERGDRPSGFISDDASATPAIDNKSASSTQEHHEYHKPTIEDESAEANKDTTVATTASADNQKVQKQSEPPATRFWVTERSVGEFHRSFAFPNRVDQDAVKASLKNGILSIVVPKAQAQKPRRVNIE